MLKWKGIESYQDARLITRDAGFRGNKDLSGRLIPLPTDKWSCHTTEPCVKIIPILSLFVYKPVVFTISLYPSTLQPI